MYIGIDDTDSRGGMCTTYLATIIIERAREIGVDLIGYPRLVRLNPNIPWKTRGNGAISLKLGKGTGKRFLVGNIDGKDIHAFQRGKSIDFDVLKIVKGIEKYFVLKDESTNPGIVFSPRKLPEKLYWKAVQEVVNIEYVKNLLKKYNANYVKFKNGQGIIGASAAIAWRARRHTYELLTYLTEEKWKEERKIDKESVIKMDRAIKSTFDNYDYENNYIAIMPHSRTPVLFGIRGTSPEDLLKAKDMIEGSRYSKFLIFLTNQASDDHLVRKRISEIQEFENVIIRGEVSSKPRKIEGGHVIFTLKDKSGYIDCAAYEPTKGFRHIVEKLHPGDIVEVYGSVRKTPRSINIEKIRILKLKEIKIKVENPTCPICGRKMESIGRGKGYRCRRCGTRAGEKDAKYEILKRDIKEGWYEVPVIARRHLSRPLKLLIEDIS